jgi:hypothetical protein
MPSGAVDYYMHGHQPPPPRQPNHHPQGQPNHHPQGQVQQRILQMQQILSSQMTAEEKLHRIGDFLGRWMMYESQSQGGTMY